MSDDPEPRPPRVFVSYGHDTPEHKADVLRFSTLLVENGIDVVLDEWHCDQRQDWYAWMIDQVVSADYVIVIASPRYREAGDGRYHGDRNRGVRTEAGILRDRLHGERDHWMPRMLPVVLPGRSTDEIPLFLEPYCLDHYRIRELNRDGLDNLLRTLLRRPAHVRPPIGPAPAFPADQPDTPALRRLRTLSENALRDAATVVPPNVLHPKGVGLDLLYVPRKIEPDLVSRLAVPSAHIVVGEPGYGKTSLLWNLHRTLTAAGRQPFFVKATALLAGLSGEGSAQALDLATVDAALRACTALKADALLLVDTLDLLMHSAETRELVGGLLALGRRHQVPLVVTCRPGEAALLESTDEVADGLRVTRLGLYEPAERAFAVARYAEVFYRTGTGALSVSEIQQRVLNAVYHDLPLREVCDNPLTLRMLFELYAPHVLDEQVDVASLYDRFWELRVQRDARAGEEGAADPVHAARPTHSDLDLGATARVLAQVMLGAGTPEPEIGEAYEWLTRLAGAGRDDVIQRVGLLAARGVLAVSADNGTVRFFHQTFFEYAAGRYIGASGRAGELVDKVCADPGDLLLAAVAAQALPRLATRGESVRELCRLLGASEQNAVTLGLAIYAHWPDGHLAVTDAARVALATAPADAVRRFLLLLPGIRLANTQRWTEDLRIVWARSGTANEDLRVHLLETLARLAARTPLEAAEFLAEHDCLRWIMSKGVKVIRSHGSLYLRVLAPVYAVDPAWATNELAGFADVFVEHGNAQGLADILDMLRERIDPHTGAGARQREHVLTVFAPMLDRLVAVIGLLKATRSLRAYGLLWAAGACDTDPDAVELLRDCVNAGPEPDVSTRAHIHGVGRAALALPATRAETFLDVVAGITGPDLQTAVLVGILVPLLADDDTDNSVCVSVAARCRAALAELPVRGYQNDGSRAVPVLYREAVGYARLSGDRLLDVLPEGDTDLWLHPDGLNRLVAVAAAAGHAVAGRALHAWCTDKAQRSMPFVVSFSAAQAAIMTPCQELVARQPAMLRHLIGDALLSGDPDALVAALDRAGDRSTPYVAEHRDALAALVADLVVARSGEDRRRGYRLWRGLVANAHWPPPAPDDLTAAVAGKPGTAMHVAALELGRAAVESGGWTAGQARELVPILATTTQLGHAARQRAGSRRKAPGTDGRLIDAGDDARHLLTAIACRTGMLTTAEERTTTVETALELALGGGYDLADDVESGRFTEGVRQLGWLMERLLVVEPTAAGSILRRVSAALYEINPGITRAQREIANRWRTPVGLILDHIGPAGRKAFLNDLVRKDVSIARVAIEVFAKLYAPPPTWFRALAQDRQLHPKIKETIRGNLFFYTRSHGSRPWHELLDATAVSG